MKKHVLVGAGAGLALLLVYLGIIALAQGIEHALEQTATIWYWVAALVAGFGTQAGLFSFIRQGLRERQAAATASMATSGGVSAGSMAACCAHHLADALPFFGLSGLAAFLSSYQTLFILAGVLSNIIGITIMLESIQRHGLSRKLAGWQWNMSWIKRGAMVSAVLVIAVAVLALL
ncbi:MAG: hypothetical protein HY530_02520 [Chloroflexi bacterium]|nr:hypothetical protein [Chloroflexota bacterium]